MDTMTSLSGSERSIRTTFISLISQPRQNYTARLTSHASILDESEGSFGVYMSNGKKDTRHMMFVR